MLKSPNIIVVGAKGNMGQRYVQILKLFGVRPFEADLNDEWPGDLWDGAIIATPTETHIELVERLLRLKAPILCEKPISPQQDDVSRVCQQSINQGTPLWMVCNWQYACPNYVHLTPGKHDIHYDYFKTGSDGYWWDTIQLQYLARQGSSIVNNSLIWKCTIDSKPITRIDIDRSYVTMLQEFMAAISYKRHMLWDAKDIIESHKLMHERMEMSGCQQ